MDWRGFRISEKGIKPLNEKIQGISEKMKPKNLKELRSYLGAVNQLTKFKPGLAKITEPFRDLLKREGNWDWKEKHNQAFNQVQKSVQKIIQLSHFNRIHKLRIECDASHEGLGALLMQKNEKNEWELLSCASRYLSDYETRYSTNELELLAIVWAVEHFRNYVYGLKFEVISDHKALETALKSNHGNKTYSSRLTRWIDRLLPFDMEIIHQPGRTMGLADYLSRHPSDYNENEWSKNSKELWESWFVVISVENVNENHERQLRANQRLTKLFKQSIRARDAESEKEMSETADRLKWERKQITCKMSRLQIGRERNATRNLIRSSKHQTQIVKPKEIEKSSELKTSPLQSIVSSVEEASTSVKINPEITFVKVKTFKEITDGLFMANYQAARGLQNSDQMRQAVLNSIHSGQSGRDAMLGAVDEVWWPQIIRQIVATAKTCGNCQKAGKNIRTIKRQKEFGNIRKPKQVNEEIALDFMGPFSGAHENRKYLLVAIDHFSAYPTLQFVKSTDIKGVEKFLRKYISNNGIPQIVRTDQATVFMGNEFRNLREEFGIRHIVCPVYDHRGNGKVERLIRTVNERLRANPEILAEKRNKLFYQLVSALRINKGKDGKSPFERHTGRKPNTVTSIIVKLYKELNNLGYDKSVELDRLEDFPRDDDSMIFVRERQRKGKLAGLFKKRRGRVTKETEHTVQFAPEGKAEVTLSKREVARAPKAV